MSTIEESIDIDVPIRTAYNQWTQFEEFPSFMEGVEEVTQEDEKTFTGSRRSPVSVASGRPTSPNSIPTNESRGRRLPG